jgi:hypothetical protein
MIEVLHDIAGYLPTGVVALVVGWWGYKNTRAGQRDTRRMQEKANAVSETQTALNAYKDLYEAMRARAERAEERQHAAEEKAERCESLSRSEFESAIRSMTDLLPKKDPSQTST